MDFKNINSVLNCIEEEESRLLTWGDTGGFFSKDEILQTIQKQLPGLEPDDVFDSLIDYVFIYPIHNSQNRIIGYRSRMGEAVHLYRNLRQWMHGKRIETSKSLVSDFRFLRRPRYYPIRDIPLNQLLDNCRKEGINDDIVLKALAAQVGDFKLSGFQLRATLRIIKAWIKHKTRVKYPSATITCAGTGSGKTMSFYLPALSSLIDDLKDDNQSGVRILSIYPRQELLKDQFNETWQACRNLDEIALNKIGRKIKIGALFGKTPNEAKYALKNGQHYHYTGLMKCPSSNCDGEMRWNKADIDRSVEKLVCHLCNRKVFDDEVMLTRKSMENNPPDILFTTTEMLNQNLGHPFRQKLFGIKTNNPVPLVLLDEVHTYGGNQGAQVAYLLRRWMKISNSAPHFVGLSATLSDAESFFSNLTGTSPSRTRLIESQPHEMESEGAEYLMAIRGDPVSKTALLSTTIQASMLTRRVLDFRLNKPSKGNWGCKTFIFTDDLDVNNRLYSQLADAEGYTQHSYQGLIEHDRGPLAKLRNPDEHSSTSKPLASLSNLIDMGQNWSSLKRNGFSLDENDKASISRTSSQDYGVDIESDVVVATASLEVGFNDPDVGAVLQHKSPRNVASYLQRKGRAGRKRDMRPWTVIVLSEFGKDRQTFQHYEQLIDPKIDMLSLPIDNSHVIKMQAAMATLDWLSLKINASLWLILNQPKTKSDNTLTPKVASLLPKIEETLQTGSRLQDELSNYIQDALQISDDQLNNVMWQFPRPILLGLLPTLRKIITTKWGRWDYNKNTCVEWATVNQNWASPVPSYIPDKLSSS